MSEIPEALKIVIAVLASGAWIAWAAFVILVWYDIRKTKKRK